MAYISKVKTPDNTTYKLLSKFYAVCDTAAATAAKTVSIDNFTLQQGVTVIINFTYANSASNPTLNVSSTGAKNICQYGTTKASTTSETTGWYAGAIVMLTYDGTSWVMNKGFNSNDNTTYTPVKLGFGYGICSTATSSPTKIVNISNYMRQDYGIVVVKFEQDVDSGAGLYINSSAIKSIYYRGTLLSSGIIKANDTATFMYYDDKYHLLTIDRPASVHATFIEDSEPTSASTQDIWFVVQNDNCTITYELNGITSSNTNTSIARGSSYSTTLSLQDNSTTPYVIVTMGSTNITATAYNTSTQQISISEVKGNIIIDATAISELDIEES